MTEINNTTEGIGSPLVEAMYALLEAANNCVPEEDYRALHHMANAGFHILAAITYGISPPDEEDDGTSTGPLAYELHRQADAAYACIYLRTVDADRMRRGTYTPETSAFKLGWPGTSAPTPKPPWFPGKCHICNVRRVIRSDTGICPDCHADPYRNVKRGWTGTKAPWS